MYPIEEVVKMNDLIIMLICFQVGWSFAYVFKNQIKQFVQFNKDCFYIKKDDCEL